MMLARERAYYAARTMRALELLVFGEHSGPELAETLGIHRRTARRLLSELAADDYLTQDTPPSPPRHPASRRAGPPGRRTAPVPATRRPWVAVLASQTAVTAHLWISAYTDVVCVLHAHPTIPPRQPEPMLRELLPAHASAAGKALLAHRTAWREDLLARPLTRHTPHTRTDPATCSPTSTARADAATPPTTKNTNWAAARSPHPSLKATTPSPRSASPSPAPTTTKQTATRSRPSSPAMPPN
jgi:DNA-binding IclR family transcriptional regulator